MENEHQARESTALITTAADEYTPIRRKNRKLKNGCNWTNFCISSNSALMILLWSFLISLWYNLVFYPDNYSQILPEIIPEFVLYVSLSVYGFSAIVNMFYPLAGFLGDVKCGRFKIVKISLKLTISVMTALIILAGMITGVIFLKIPVHNDIYIIVQIVLLLICICILVVLLTGLVCFFTNVIQFGMDQLHDSPAQDSSLFIHWYIWISY